MSTKEVLRDKLVSLIAYIKKYHRELKYINNLRPWINKKKTKTITVEEEK